MLRDTGPDHIGLTDLWITLKTIRGSTGMALPLVSNVLMISSLYFISWPMRNVLAMMGVVYEYGMKSIDGIGSVMKKLATLPLAMLP